MDALEFSILAKMPTKVNKYNRSLLSLEGEWMIRLQSEGMNLVNIQTPAQRTCSRSLLDSSSHAVMPVGTCMPIRT